MAIFCFSFRTTIKNVLFYGVAAYTAQNFTVNVRDIVRLVFFDGERNMLFSASSIILLGVMFTLYYFVLLKKLKKGNAENMVNNGYLIGFLSAVLFTVNIFRQ